METFISLFIYLFVYLFIYLFILCIEALIANIKKAKRGKQLTRMNVVRGWLIDSTSRTWNSQALRNLVDPQDVKIIENIPMSRTQMVDRDGWYFTNNEKYMVKS